MRIVTAQRLAPCRSSEDAGGRRTRPTRRPATPTPNPARGRPATAFRDHQSFVLGCRSADVDLRPLTRCPPQIPFMRGESTRRASTRSSISAHPAHHGGRSSMRETRQPRQPDAADRGAHVLHLLRRRDLSGGRRGASRCWAGGFGPPEPVPLRRRAGAGAGQFPHRARPHHLPERSSCSSCSCDRHDKPVHLVADGPLRAHLPGHRPAPRQHQLPRA